VGQDERPQINPVQRPPDKKLKKGKEPRAVGILELDSKGQATLVPVAILIDGRFYDASAYKADPVPMALDSGTVYEAEESGESQGLFTINAARHGKSAAANPWVGTGSYLPKGAEAKKTTRKAEDVPLGINGGGDEPPRLTRKASGKSDASSDVSSDAKPAAAPPAGSDPPKAAQSSPKDANAGTADKPADSNAKNDTQSKAEGKTTQTPNESSSGKTETADKSQSDKSSGETPSDRSGDKYYRPQLRRGKPTEPAPPSELDTATVSQKSSTPSFAGSAPAGSSGSLRMLAAISDAGGPDPRTYKFFWKTGEEEERRGQMLALAQSEVRTYAAALAKNQIPAGKVKATSAHRTQVKQAQPELENVRFQAFDVWLTNQPVMVLSAEARLPAASGAAAGANCSITLVARTDIYGNLRKLYSAVTDNFHLDVTPRLELIDVVDADGDGRGEFLFRETSDAGSGYVIYRATADKLWKMFDSLNGV
jgi:hypothetical protein